MLANSLSISLSYQIERNNMKEDIQITKKSCYIQYYI